MRWLEKEAFGKRICLYIIICIAVDFVWSTSMVMLMNSFNIPISERHPHEDDIPIRKLSFPIILLAGVACEECGFRLPLIILIINEWATKYVLIGACFLSFAFGLLHGGFSHVFIQGVSGFTFCLLFLKCGGLQGNPLKGLIVSTTAHFIFDAILVSLILASGGNSI